MEPNQKLTATKQIFSKYGHDCTLDYLPDRHEYGDIPNEGGWNKFKRWWIRMTVVAEPTDDVHVHAKHLQSFGSITKERRRQVLLYPYRIHPFSKAYTVWACYMLLIMGIELITTPIEFLLREVHTSFIHTLVWKICFMGISDFSLILNILMSFLIGYYDEPHQEVVLAFTSIAKNYFTGLFIIDLISIFPSELVCFLSPPVSKQFTFYDAFGMLRILVVIRFYKFINMLMVEKYHVNFYYYMTVLVVIFTALFWHITCCLLMFLRLKLGTSKQLTEQLAIGRSLESQFERGKQSRYPGLNLLLLGYYRGSQIIYNSSCGKNLPTSEAEIILIWFAWYGSLIFFIYILTLIMVIMTARTSSSHKYAEMERQLKDYMSYKQLPSGMRSRIMTYYGFRFQNNYFQESDILATISEQLRQEINLHACRKLVENVIFFRNLPLNLLVRIISCLKIEIYLVNDIIIRANTPGSSMYFISTGTVAIFTKTGKEICHLEDGSHFGEVALIIKNTLRTASVVAVEVSEIYRLDQKDFVKAINPYPDLLANIQRIAAERMEVAEMMDDHNRDN